MVRSFERESVILKREEREARAIMHERNETAKLLRVTRARERETRVRAEAEVRQAEEREHERVVAAELEAQAALARERVAREGEHTARGQLMLMGRR